MYNSRLFRRGDGTGRRAGLTMARLRDIAAQANVKRSGTLSREAAAGAKIRCNRNIYTLAGVMELVDVPDSKSGAARRGGSSPPHGTKKARRQDSLPFSFFGFYFFLAFLSGIGT